MRLEGSLLFALATMGCAGPFGRAPLVLTEVPNRPSGRELVVLGAERSGCRVTEAGGQAFDVTCPEGRFEVPTFAGPPTFAVRCVDAKLRDESVCKALVRKVLLASENAPHPSS